MRIHPAEQGTQAWRLARAGLPTASQFHRIITPKKLTMSSQAWAYLNTLLFEWAEGRPYEDVSGDFMERGKEMEAFAVSAYEWDHDAEVQKVGLCLTDDGKVGCSPDGLVGSDGGLEIKCLSGPEHVGVLRAPDEFVESRRCQVQGCLWVTGRKWWDLLAWHPHLPSVLRRVEPDPAFQKALTEALGEFVRDLAAERARLTETYGIVPVLSAPSGTYGLGSIGIRESDWSEMKR